MKTMQFPMVALDPTPDEVGTIGGYLAGGAVLSYLTKDVTADYDLFPQNRKQRHDMLYYLLEDCGGHVIGVSSRAITIKTNTSVKVGHDPLTGLDIFRRPVYQVIMLRDWGTPDAIFSTFDFSASMAAIDLKTKEVTVTDGFMRAMTSKEIEWNPGTQFPLASLTRVRKYEKKGFTFPKAEMLRMGLTLMNAKPPTSWDEVVEMIGGYYGRRLTVQDNEPFSYERALTLLQQESDHEGSVIVSQDPPESIKWDPHGGLICAISDGADIFEIDISSNDNLQSGSARALLVETYDESERAMIGMLITSPPRGLNIPKVRNVKAADIKCDDFPCITICIRTVDLAAFKDFVRYHDKTGAMCIELKHIRSTSAAYRIKSGQDVVYFTMDEESSWSWWCSLVFKSYDGLVTGQITQMRKMDKEDEYNERVEANVKPIIDLIRNTLD